MVHPAPKSLQNQQRLTLSDRIDNIGRGLRSEAKVDDMLVDEDAAHCGVINARHLSRYHFKDVL